MTTVGSPRGILVAPIARQLLDALVTERDGVQLKVSVSLLRLISDQPPIGRPIWIRPIVLIARVIGCQPLRVRAIGVANIYLRMAETARCERESSSIGAERRARVVGAATHRDA